MHYHAHTRTHTVKLIHSLTHTHLTPWRTTYMHAQQLYVLCAPACLLGDIVFLTSDGVCDNFDPVVLQLARHAVCSQSQTQVGGGAGQGRMRGRPAGRHRPGLRGGCCGWGEAWFRGLGQGGGAGSGGPGSGCLRVRVGGACPESQGGGGMP